MYISSIERRKDYWRCILFTVTEKKKGKRKRKTELPSLVWVEQRPTICFITSEFLSSCWQKYHAYFAINICMPSATSRRVYIYKGGLARRSTLFSAFSTLIDTLPGRFSGRPSEGCDLVRFRFVCKERVCAHIRACAKYSSILRSC